MIQELLGAKAPSFSLTSSEGKLVSLQDFKGKKIVLYFFPKSDTPGCTKQACSFRDMNAEYANNGIVVIGISYDSPKILAAFKNKYHLPFILLSDQHAYVAEQYHAKGGIINWLFSVPQRITYIINEQGIITHILKNIHVSTHSQDVIDLCNSPSQNN
jgi:thioredoxin-dependent peroxiredoxin